MRAGIETWLARYSYHCLLGSFALGLGLSAVSQVALAGAGLAGALLALRDRRLAVACVLLLAAGLATGGARLDSIDRPAKSLRAWEQIDGAATLLERPRTTLRGSQALVRLRGTRLLAVAGEGVEWPKGALVGAEVRVRGAARPPRGRDPRSGFDQAAWFRRRGIAAEVALTDVESTGRRRGGVAGTLDRARDRAERSLSAGLPAGKAALARGMVLGQDEAIDPLTRDDWRDSGLAHLLAVSGQNVMLLIALALPFLALSGVAPRTRLIVLIGLIAVYVPLAGAGPSLQRAAVMGVAGLVAVAAGRPSSAAYALLLAAAVTLGVNPRVAADPGWQLSFAAVVGILLARPRGKPRPIADGTRITVAATIATAPLLALHFGALPLMAVPANLLALPAVAPVMWIGMAEAAAGQLGVVPPLAVVQGPLLGYLQTVATKASELPGAVVELRIGAPVAIASYAALGLAAFGGRRVRHRVATHAQVAREQARTLPARVRAAIALLLVSVLVFVLLPLGAPDPPERLTISFLDVGQGDAILIQHPDGTAVLFDGGRPDARVVRLLKQAGVRRLSMVVATHQSADHHGGLVEVIRRIPVGVLLENGDGTRDPTYLTLLRDALARKVNVIPAEAGQVLHAGPLTIKVLWPRPRPPGPPPGDPNERAVIAILSSGEFDLLLSGDAESPALDQVDLPDVEAIKVPHHGSADPGLPKQLTRLRPEVAVIAVGKGNGYGHPRPETLKALEVVPNVRRTDEDGTVRLEVGPDGLRLRP